MTDEHHIEKGQMISNKKENIRVFVQRKRLVNHRLQAKSNNFDQFTSYIEKHLNTNKKCFRNNKNIVIVNYKPVYMNSRQSKVKPAGTSSLPVNTISSATQTNQLFAKKPTINSTSSPTNPTKNPQLIPYDVPDVDDPLVFIEMMYQQLFTDDGQLRSETEPSVLANRVKEMITQSRRNSVVPKDSILLNRQHEKRILTPCDSSVSSFCMSNNKCNKREKNEEEFHSLLQKTRTPNTSLQSSKRSSMENFESHLQELHAFVNSYTQNEKQPNINSDEIFCFDDTDNEDFDEFSEFNSSRKTIRPLSPTSFDDEMTHTDSKFLSSGYQSLRSSKSMNNKKRVENNSSNYLNCIEKPKPVMTTAIIPMNFIQPMRDMIAKLYNFVFISKNIFLLPFCIFLLRQRSITSSN